MRLVSTSVAVMKRALAFALLLAVFAPPAMEQSLQLLGPADAAGRRQFSVGGTL